MCIESPFFVGVQAVGAETNVLADEPIEPDDHAVIVCFESSLVPGPFVFLWFVGPEWFYFDSVVLVCLAIRWCTVFMRSKYLFELFKVVIAEFVPWVVVRPFLLDSQKFGVSECYDIRTVASFEHEHIGYSFVSLLFEVDHNEAVISSF